MFINNIQLLHFQSSASSYWFRFASNGMKSREVVPLKLHFEELTDHLLLLKVPLRETLNHLVESVTVLHLKLKKLIFRL